MKTFKHYITEIGDSTYPFEYEGSDGEENNPRQYSLKRSTDKDGGGKHQYTINHPTDKNKNISVTISHEYNVDNRGKRSAEVSFTRENDRSHDKTNDMSTVESARVFSTIHKIMKKHAESNPSVYNFEFASDKSEPTRQNLYKRFTSKLGGRTEDENKSYNTHIIPAKNL
jgi:hypothetical protein